MATLEDLRSYMGRALSASGFVAEAWANICLDLARDVYDIPFDPTRTREPQFQPEPRNWEAWIRPSKNNPPAIVRVSRSAFTFDGVTPRPDLLASVLWHELVGHGGQLLPGGVGWAETRRVVRELQAYAEQHDWSASQGMPQDVLDYASDHAARLWPSASAQEQVELLASHPTLEAMVGGIALV